MLYYAGKHWMVSLVLVCLLLFYVLAPSTVISGWIPICNSVRSLRLYSVAPLGNQGTSTMTRFPTQSHYPDTDPTSHCPILIMQSTWVGSNKYNFYNSLVGLDQGSSPRSPARKASTPPIRSSLALVK